MSKSPILLKDGETVVIIARTSGPTVSDPTDEFPYVSQAYRVVADRVSPTLALVPLSETPVRLKAGEVDETLKPRLRILDLDRNSEIMLRAHELLPLPPTVTGGDR